MTATPIEQPYNNETRFALMEQSIVHLGNKLDQSLYHINQTLERFEKRFDRIDDEIKSIKSDVRANFFWTLGVIGAVLGVVAHGFHWF